MVSEFKSQAEAHLLHCQIDLRRIDMKATGTGTDTGTVPPNFVFFRFVRSYFRFFFHFFFHLPLLLGGSVEKIIELP